MSGLAVGLGKVREPRGLLYHPRYHRDFILYVKNGNKEFLKLFEMLKFLRSRLKPNLLIKDNLLLRADKENSGISATFQLLLQGSQSFHL